ncbi:MAG: M28 family peptidase [Bacteroidales bacterium]|nr:M28 family peptidase [Bacteroidales bacterium]
MEREMGKSTLSNKFKFSNLRISIFALLLIISTLSSAQSYKYAIYCKDTLASEYMAGRAYVDEGDKKAATFIRNELKESGVELLGENGFQKLNFPINNIMDLKVSMRYLKKPLKLGEDYLVFGSSPSANMELENVKPLIFNTKKQIEEIKPKKLQDKVLLFNTKTLSYVDIIVFLRGLKKENVTPKLAVIQGYDKIPYYTGRALMDFPILQLKGNIIDKKIKHLALEIKSEFISSYQSQNVWGIVEGTKYKDSCFVFIAHYDHLGKVGDVHFPGANDNASGVAVLLDLAKYYAKNPAEHSVVFIFATGEEVGLLGSKFAAENPYIDLEKVKFLFNLDMCGTGATGVAVINGLKEPKAGKLLQKINEEYKWFIKVFLGEESCNSDHCHFVQRGVPAHFLFTYGCEYNEYHTIYDNGVDLPFTKHIDFCNLLKEFVRRY